MFFNTDSANAYYLRSNSNPVYDVEEDLHVASAAPLAGRGGGGGSSNNLGSPNARPHNYSPNRYPQSGGGGGATGFPQRPGVPAQGGRYAGTVEDDAEAAYAEAAAAAAAAAGRSTHQVPPPPRHSPYTSADAEATSGSSGVDLLYQARNRGYGPASSASEIWAQAAYLLRASRPSSASANRPVPHMSSGGVSSVDAPMYHGASSTRPIRLPATTEQAGPSGLVTATRGVAGGSHQRPSSAPSNRAPARPSTNAVAVTAGFLPVATRPALYNSFGESARSAVQSGGSASMQQQQQQQQQRRPAPRPATDRRAEGAARPHLPPPSPAARARPSLEVRGDRYPNTTSSPTAGYSSSTSNIMPLFPGGDDVDGDIATANASAKYGGAGSSSGVAPQSAAFSRYTHSASDPINAGAAAGRRPSPSANIVTECWEETEDAGTEPNDAGAVGEAAAERNAVDVRRGQLVDNEEENLDDDLGGARAPWWTVDVALTFLAGYYATPEEEAEAMLAAATTRSAADMRVVRSVQCRAPILPADASLDEAWEMTQSFLRCVALSAVDGTAMSTFRCTPQAYYYFDKDFHQYVRLSADTLALTSTLLRVVLVAASTEEDDDEGSPSVPRLEPELGSRQGSSGMAESQMQRPASGRQQQQQQQQQSPLRAAPQSGQPSTQQQHWMALNESGRPPSREPSGPPRRRRLPFHNEAEETPPLPPPHVRRLEYLQQQQQLAADYAPHSSGSRVSRRPPPTPQDYNLNNEEEAEFTNTGGYDVHAYDAPLAEDELYDLHLASEQQQYPAEVWDMAQSPHEEQLDDYAVEAAAAVMDQQLRASYPISGRMQRTRFVPAVPLGRRSSAPHRNGFALRPSNQRPPTAPSLPLAGYGGGSWEAQVGGSTTAYRPSPPFMLSASQPAYPHPPSRQVPLTQPKRPAPQYFDDPLLQRSTASSVQPVPPSASWLHTGLTDSFVSRGASQTSMLTPTSPRSSPPPHLAYRPTTHPYFDESLCAPPPPPHSMNGIITFASASQLQRHAGASSTSGSHDALGALLRRSAEAMRSKSQSVSPYSDQRTQVYQVVEGGGAEAEEEEERSPLSAGASSPGAAAAAAATASTTVGSAGSGTCGHQKSPPPPPREVEEVDGVGETAYSAVDEVERLASLAEDAAAMEAGMAMAFTAAQGEASAAATTSSPSPPPSAAAAAATATSSTITAVPPPHPSVSPHSPHRLQQQQQQQQQQKQLQPPHISVEEGGSPAPVPPSGVRFQTSPGASLLAPFVHLQHQQQQQHPPIATSAAMPPSPQIPVSAEEEIEHEEEMTTEVYASAQPATEVREDTEAEAAGFAALPPPHTGAVETEVEPAAEVEVSAASEAEAERSAAPVDTTCAPIEGTAVTAAKLPAAAPPAAEFVVASVNDDDDDNKAASGHSAGHVITVDASLSNDEEGEAMPHVNTSEVIEEPSLLIRDDRAVEAVPADTAATGTMKATHAAACAAATAPTNDVERSGTGLELVAGRTDEAEEDDEDAEVDARLDMLLESRVNPHYSTEITGAATGTTADALAEAKGTQAAASGDAHASSLVAENAPAGASGEAVAEEAATAPVTEGESDEVKPSSPVVETPKENSVEEEGEERRKDDASAFSEDAPAVEAAAESTEMPGDDHTAEEPPAAVNLEKDVTEQENEIETEVPAPGQAVDETEEPENADAAAIPHDNNDNAPAEEETKEGENQSASRRDSNDDAEEALTEAPPGDVEAASAKAENIEPDVEKAESAHNEEQNTSAHSVPQPEGNEADADTSEHAAPADAAADASAAALDTSAVAEADTNEAEEHSAEAAEAPAVEEDAEPAEADVDPPSSHDEEEVQEKEEVDDAATKEEADEAAAAAAEPADSASEHPETVGDEKPAAPSEDEHNASTPASEHHSEEMIMEASVAEEPTEHAEAHDKEEEKDEAEKAENETDIVEGAASSEAPPAAEQPSDVDEKEASEASAHPVTEYQEAAKEEELTPEAQEQRENSAVSTHFRSDHAEESDVAPTAAAAAIGAEKENGNDKSADGAVASSRVSVREDSDAATELSAAASSTHEPHLDESAVQPPVKEEEEETEVPAETDETALNVSAEAENVSQPISAHEETPSASPAENDEENNRLADSAAASARTVSEYEDAAPNDAGDAATAVALTAEAKVEGDAAGNAEGGEAGDAASEPEANGKFSEPEAEEEASEAADGSAATSPDSDDAKNAISSDAEVKGVDAGGPDVPAVEVNSDHDAEAHEEEEQREEDEGGAAVNNKNDDAPLHFTAERAAESSQNLLHDIAVEESAVHYSNDAVTAVPELPIHAVVLGNPLVAEAGHEMAEASIKTMNDDRMEQSENVPAEVVVVAAPVIETDTLRRISVSGEGSGAPLATVVFTPPPHPLEGHLDDESERPPLTAEPSLFATSAGSHPDHGLADTAAPTTESREAGEETDNVVAAATATTATGQHASTTASDHDELSSARETTHSELAPEVEGEGKATAEDELSTHAVEHNTSAEEEKDRLHDGIDRGTAREAADEVKADQHPSVESNRPAEVEVVVMKASPHDTLAPPFDINDVHDGPELAGLVVAVEEEEEKEVAEEEGAAAPAVLVAAAVAVPSPEEEHESTHGGAVLVEGSDAPALVIDKDNANSAELGEKKREEDEDATPVFFGGSEVEADEIDAAAAAEPHKEEVEQQECVEGEAEKEVEEPVKERSAVVVHESAAVHNNNNSSKDFRPSPLRLSHMDHYSGMTEIHNGSTEHLTQLQDDLDAPPMFHRSNAGVSATGVPATTMAAAAAASSSGMGAFGTTSSSGAGIPGWASADAPPLHSRSGRPESKGGATEDDGDDGSHLNTTTTTHGNETEEAPVDAPMNAFRDSMSITHTPTLHRRGEEGQDGEDTSAAGTTTSTGDVADMLVHIACSYTSVPSDNSAAAAAAAATFAAAAAAKRTPSESAALKAEASPVQPAALEGNEAATQGTGLTQQVVEATSSGPVNPASVSTATQIDGVVEGGASAAAPVADAASTTPVTTLATTPVHAFPAELSPILPGSPAALAHAPGSPLATSDDEMALTQQHLPLHPAPAATATSAPSSPVADVDTPMPQLSPNQPSAAPLPAAPRNDNAMRKTMVLLGFPGSAWEFIMTHHYEPMHEAFVTDASTAANVPHSAIQDVRYSKGSLMVDLYVLHPASVGEQEIRDQMCNYAYPNLWALYEEKKRERKKMLHGEGGGGILRGSRQTTLSAQEEVKWSPHA